MLEFYQCGVERFIVSALPSALLQHLFIFPLQRTRFVADRKKITRLNKNSKKDYRQLVGRLPRAPIENRAEHDSSKPLKHDIVESIFSI